MSFITQGITGASRVVTQQPTSTNSSTGLEGANNAGGWIPAIERSIIKLGQNESSPVNTSSVVIQQQPTPTAPPTEQDAPPPYSALFPGQDPNITFDCNISRSFQTNEWQEITINGQKLFKDLNENDRKLLEEAVSTPDASIYSVKITLDVAEDQKCSNFHDFLKLFAFVKNYLAFKNEKQMKSTIPQEEIRQTTRYDPGLTNQVDGAPPQTRQPEVCGDPFCCWLFFQPTHPYPYPCCFCCDSSHDVSPPVTTDDHGCCDCDCGNCDCGDCDCGDCDCGDCGDCGGCDCTF